jgi:hypothetical protein
VAGERSRWSPIPWWLRVVTLFAVFIIAGLGHHKSVGVIIGGAVAGTAVIVGLAYVVLRAWRVALRVPNSAPVSRLMSDGSVNGGLIEVYRPRWIPIGAVSRYRVVIDDVAAGHARKGRAVHFVVAAGERRVAVRTGSGTSNTVDVEVAPGSIRSFVATPNYDIWSQIFTGAWNFSKQFRQIRTALGPAENRPTSLLLTERTAVASGPPS